MTRLGLSIAFALIFAAPMSAADKKDKKESPPTIAHIELSGDLDESPVAESLLGGAGGESLRMKLDRIAKAKADPLVKGLLIEIKDLSFGVFSFGKIEEVRAAIADFRKSGKKTWAYTESIGGLDYLVALACETVVIPEGGEFGMIGLNIEMMFFKDTFAKFNIKADFLTMGDAKGAADPYLRTELSPENKKQYDMVLDDLYENGIIGAMIAARPERKWTVESVKKLIDGGPYAAKKALALGLVDRVSFFDALEVDMLKVAGNKATLSRDYGKSKPGEMENPLTAMMKLFNPTKKAGSKNPKIAVIYAVGAIESGKGGGGLFGGASMGSDTIIAAIKTAEKDDTVKGIVLRVDSPGGSALASDLMWHELRSCKKPVIASMGDVAASGGYYIAMGTQKIYAEPGTLTGSIGVISGKIAIGGAKEMLGLKTQTLSRGANSGIMNGDRPFSESERKAMLDVMKDIYDQFIDKTVAGRQAAGAKLTRETLLPIAGGRIWTGRRAKELGLVDELGTLDDAIADMKKRAKIDGEKDVELLILPEPTSFLDRLGEGKFGLSMQSELLGEAAKLPLLREAMGHAEQMYRLRNERTWMMLPFRMSVR